MIRAGAAAFERSRGGRLSIHVRRVLRTLVACRTPRMGGQLRQCGHCGGLEYHYLSCGDRHCPTCQGRARAKWLGQREAELLDTPYYHVVFTLPQRLRELVYCNQATMYALLLRAAGRTLVELAQAPNHLGATPGVLTILHTWGGNLSFHPHAHCVVTGGGLSPARDRWIACRGGEKFFLPVRALSGKFRGKFLAELAKLHAAGKLRFPAPLSYLSDARRFRVWLKPLYRKHWHVYAKAPFGGPARVLKYLARYSHGVAISNRRLVKLEAGRVTFICKNHAVAGAPKPMTLDACKFVCRFVQHVLPPGFTRIRYFGLLSNRDRHKRLAHCRELLGATSPNCSPSDTNHARLEEPDRPDRSESLCPHCRRGELELIAHWPRPTWQELLMSPAPWKLYSVTILPTLATRIPPPHTLRPP